MKGSIDGERTKSSGEGGEVEGRVWWKWCRMYVLMNPGLRFSVACLGDLFPFKILGLTEPGSFFKKGLSTTFSYREKLSSKLLHLYVLHANKAHLPLWFPASENCSVVESLIHKRDLLALQSISWK